MREYGTIRVSENPYCRIFYAVFILENEILLKLAISLMSVFSTFLKLSKNCCGKKRTTSL